MEFGLYLYHPIGNVINVDMFGLIPSLDLSVHEMSREKFSVEKKFPKVAYFEYFIAWLFIDVFY